MEEINTRRASVTKFENGMTYCTIEEAQKDFLSIKLAVQFNKRFVDPRDQYISAVTEKLVLGVLQSIHETKILETTLQMHEPEVFEIPNLVLFRLDLHNPTQRSLNETLAFLNHAFEIICSLDLNELETEANKIIQEDPHVKYVGCQTGENFNLESLSPHVSGSEIKLFFAENYRPENIVLVLDGNVKDLAISAAVQTYFPFFVASGLTFQLFENVTTEPFSLNTTHYANYGVSSSLFFPVKN